MRLGGTTWDDEPRGPLGHSDGDVVLHAIVDALLGAAALGDIGALFPHTAEWADADSSALTATAVALLAENGWRPVRRRRERRGRARPAIAPRRDEMAAHIAGILGIGPDAVSVKGTTSDGLGFTGDEGIAAWAVAIVERSA